MFWVICECFFRKAYVDGACRMFASKAVPKSMLKCTPGDLDPRDISTNFISKSGIYSWTKLGTVSSFIDIFCRDAMQKRWFTEPTSFGSACI